MICLLLTRMAEQDRRITQHEAERERFRKTPQNPSPPLHPHVRPPSARFTSAISDISPPDIPPGRPDLFNGLPQSCSPHPAPTGTKQQSSPRILFAQTSARAEEREPLVSCTAREWFTVEKS